MRRLLAVVPLAGLVLAGCAAPHDPEVTFYADGKTVNLEPKKYCDLDVTDCVDKTAGSLKIRPGKPVQISVPGDVADSSWTVVWTFLTAKGQEGGDNSEIFKAGTRYAYTVVLPRPDDQLKSVEVQQIGRRIDIDDTGRILFTARGTWEVTVDPA